MRLTRATPRSHSAFPNRPLPTSRLSPVLKRSMRGMRRGRSIFRSRPLPTSAFSPLPQGSRYRRRFPAARGVRVGDLLAFGELGSETIDGLITSVQPRREMSARVTLLPWSSPGVYDSETGPIPPYLTGLTALPGSRYTYWSSTVFAPTNRHCAGKGMAWSPALLSMWNQSEISGHSSKPRSGPRQPKHGRRR